MVKLPIVGHVMSLVRKPARKPLRGAAARDERLRAGFDRAPLGIAFAAPDGHWLQVNEQFRRLIGYTREELSRISFHGITHPEDAKREASLLKKLVAGEIDSYRLEKRVMEKRGRYRTIEILTSLVRSATGEPDFFVFLIDEPPQRRAAAAQETSVAELLGDVGVVRTDEKGTVTGWNPGAERIFGYTADEMIGKNRRLLWRDADGWDGKPTRQLKSLHDGQRVEMEDWRVAKDGRHLWVRTAIAPVKVDGVVKGYLEVVSPPAAVDPRRGLESTIESLRAELDTARRKEESLREALEEVRVMGEETMNELRIMTVALRKEIDRRKAAEDELRTLSAQVAAPPEPLAPEVEEIAVVAPRRAFHPLGGMAAELLRDHAAAQRSGTLVVTSGERELEIFFDKGRVYSCASNDPSTFLVQRLIDQGAITDDDRRRALELRQHTQLALGRILLILGAITEEQLVETMRRKVEEAVADLVTWSDVRWAFVEGEIPSLQLVPLRMDVDAALQPVRAPMFVASSSARASRKFHVPSCVSVRRIALEGRLGFASASEAAARGYEPCRICVRVA